MNRAVSTGLAFALAGLIAGGPAHAQVLKNHNSNAPVDVTADRIEVQDRVNRAIFTGNVHVLQAGMTIDSARMTVAYAKATTPGANPQIQRIDASGGVSVRSADQTAQGSIAIYDLNRRLITMLGGVVLNQGGSQVRGGRLVMDLNTGRSTVDGSAVGGGSTSTGRGGRVTGHFTVPQRTTAATPAKPAPAKPPAK
jgi:lipopolysaccharide export system protein LptA